MKKQPASVPADQRARRTVGDFVRALRFESAKQQHLFVANKKQEFHWKHSLLPREEKK